MIKVCLTCTKRKCTGTCNRVRTAETLPSVKRYEFNGHKYSIADICQLTGYMHKTLKNKLKKLNYDISTLLRPTKVYTSQAVLYECFGLELRIQDWAALINTSKAAIGRRLKDGMKPEFVLRTYTNTRRRLNMDKFRAKFISSGQPQPYAHKYTNYEIYTNESAEETVKWAFECLYTRRVPEMNEWLKNINDPDSDISPDYYYQGYYQLFKEDYGYYFSIVEPFTD